MLEKVISGGQTGVDQAALLVAKELGYQTGGWAPKGWRTDDGLAPWLASYGLIEHHSAGYSGRTAMNVFESHATIWFGETTTRGGMLTLGLVQHYARPHLINPDAAILRLWLETTKIGILNVAGNRLATYPWAKDQCVECLSDALLPF